VPACHRRFWNPCGSSSPPCCPPVRFTIRWVATAPGIPDRLVFDKLIQVLVFGCGYRRIADRSCSASTLRRRHEWITAGVVEQLRLLVLAAHQRLFGLDL